MLRLTLSAAAISALTLGAWAFEHTTQVSVQTAPGLLHRASEMKQVCDQTDAKVLMLHEAERSKEGSVEKTQVGKRREPLPAERLGIMLRVSTL